MLSWKEIFRTVQYYRTTKPVKNILVNNSPVINTLIKWLFSLPLPIVMVNVCLESTEGNQASPDPNCHI